MTVRYAFAHRGGRADGPDNTLATFQRALDAGATGLETDAWLTADDQVVLDHDGVLRRARRRREPLYSLRRDQLPPHIPTLAELYEAFGTGFDLAVDVKRHDVGTALVGVAERYEATERLWVVSPHSSLLSGLATPHRAVSVPGMVMRGPRRDAVLRAVRAAGADAVNARWPWWTATGVGAVHDLGMLAFGYDAQRAHTVRRCAALGLDGVFSDHVERLTGVLGETTQ